LKRVVRKGFFQKGNKVRLKGHKKDRCTKKGQHSRKETTFQEVVRRLVKNWQEASISSSGERGEEV
jgi:hypothetical protein